MGHSGSRGISKHSDVKYLFLFLNCRETLKQCFSLSYDGADLFLVCYSTAEKKTLENVKNMVQ